MFGFHWPELIVLLGVALVIFGPKRLPEIGGALGKGIKEFKKGTTELESHLPGSHPVEMPPAQSNDVRVAEPPLEPARTVVEKDIQ